VIHDPGISTQILDLVQPPRYREAAEPARALERSIKLAEDGWRVVRLVKGSAVGRAVESAPRFAERGIAFQVALDADEIDDAAHTSALFRGPFLLGPSADGPSALLVSLVAPARAAEPRQPPVSFSMSGLAG
jgi:hypothetical protein